jgi:hypothetical protein
MINTTAKISIAALLLSPLLCVGVSVMFVVALCDFTAIRLRQRFGANRAIAK